jgi:hypothetical protein
MAGLKGALKPGSTGSGHHLLADGHGAAVFVRLPHHSLGAGSYEMAGTLVRDRKPDRQG